MPAVVESCADSPGRCDRLRQKAISDSDQEIARQYVAGIMRRLREHEYNPELMKLYIVGGGGCLNRHFGENDPNRVTINDDIRATAKGYEFLADPPDETEATNRSLSGLFLRGVQ